MVVTIAGGKTDVLANNLGNYELRAVAYTQPTTRWLAAFTVTPVQAGTGGTEVSGGAYARISITCNTSNWAAFATSLTTSGAPFNYSVATANWGRVYSICLMDASSAGNVTEIIPLVTGSYKNFDAIALDVTNNTISCYSHGFVAGDAVRFFPVGGTLPAPLAVDTQYFVISAGLVTDAFSVSTTAGGSAVDITGTGAGEVAKDASFSVVTNSQLTFATGSISVGV